MSTLAPGGDLVLFLTYPPFSRSPVTNEGLRLWNLWAYDELFNLRTHSAHVAHLKLVGGCV